MAFWDADRGIAFSDSVDGQLVILRTDDGGAHWTRVPAERPARRRSRTKARSRQAAPTSRSTGAIRSGSARCRGGARVLRSSDGGRTWSAAATPLAAGPSSGIFSIAFRDAEHGIVVGGDYRKESEADRQRGDHERWRPDVDEW